MRVMISDGDCLCNRPLGVTFIEVLGQHVGLFGVEELFGREKLYSFFILHSLSFCRGPS